MSDFANLIILDDADDFFTYIDANKNPATLLSFTCTEASYIVHNNTRLARTNTYRHFRP